MQASLLNKLILNQVEIVATCPLPQSINENGSDHTKNQQQHTLQSLLIMALAGIKACLTSSTTLFRVLFFCAIFMFDL